MSPQDETEAETRSNRIFPVLQHAGWGVAEGSRIREEVICPGRIQTGGRRGKGLSCDYVLFYKGHKLAVIEAKRSGLSYRDGVGQAKDYAARLGARFAYATNGIGWYAVDMETGAEGELETPFPSPEDLWRETFADASQWREAFGAVEFETDGGKWGPRYYQHKAITAVLEAIGRGERRILLTLATGTGKTSIAFQIAWKLFHGRWSLADAPVRRPRILFLADRNILADQAYNAFSAFPSDAVARVDPALIRKRGGVPKNASVFFTIFQTFMTGEGEPVFHDYPHDFFDFIVIDECHRGGASDESQWRDILNYFAPAAQLGLTATPKRRQNADTYAYFGEPVYTYALRDGIEDGYLTPFKVRQMASTIDAYVYDPDDEVVAGEVEAGRAYDEDAFNRTIIIEERERSRVREFMRQIDPRQKTLVFCGTQEHAGLVRDLINQEKDDPDPLYCCRVTANDGAVGEEHLRTFQDNDKTIPTILTTSQKLSTGVDARDVRHIVLMRPIRSMIEFKQIIGRGTRVFEGKDFFTIWDFVKAYEHFQDPEWDGEPEEPEAPEGPRRPGGFDDGPRPPYNPEPEPQERPQTVVIRLSEGNQRRIRYVATTTYWSSSGRPMSAQEFMQQLFGDLTRLIADEDQLHETWSDPENRAHFLDQLSDHGYDQDRLDDIRRLVDAPNSDLYDVLAYILFEVAPKTRHDRADAVRTDGLDDYQGEMRALLLSILASYEDRGEAELAADRLGHYLIARYGSVGESRAKVGDPQDVRAAFRRLQAELYAS